MVPSSFFVLTVRPSKLAALAVAVGVLAACSGAPSATSPSVDVDSEGAPLTQASDDSTASVASDAAKVCMTTFVSCVRAGGDVKACHADVRTCIGEVLPRPVLDADGGACKGGGPREQNGDGGAPPRGRDKPGEERRGPGGKGAGAQGGPGPHGERGAPPGARCVEELVTCAKGSDEAATCVDAHAACVKDAAAAREALSSPATE